MTKNKKHIFPIVIAMLLNMASLAFAETGESIKAAAKESAKAIEDTINKQTVIFEQKKEQAHRDIVNHMDSSGGSAAGQHKYAKRPPSYTAEIRSKESIIDASIANEFKNSVSKILDNNEDALRKKYADAAAADKQNTIMLYDAILDQLTDDGYIDKKESEYRKSKISNEWPEVR